MPEDLPHSVLKRMASNGQDAAEPSSGPPPMFPSRALERAVVRAGQSVLGLALSVAEMSETSPGLEDLADGADENALVLLLNGPDEAQGVAVVSSELLALVVAQRMSGHLPETLPDPRPPTRIDAAMAADLLDRLLEVFEAPLADRDEVRWTQGFRAGERIADPRLVRFSLPDIAYRGFDLDLDLVGSQHRPKLRLVFPAQPAAEIGAKAAVTSGAAEWGGALRQRVLSAAVPLNAVLLRQTVPLSEVGAWVPGQTIVFSPAALEAVRLEGPGEVLMATGQLGQSKGDRAFRLAAIAGAPVPPPIPAALPPDAAPGPAPGEE